jgi:hypothetical protein
MLGVSGDTRGMPDDETQGRSKRVTKEGCQMTTERTEVKDDIREMSDDKGMDHRPRIPSPPRLRVAKTGRNNLN